MPRNVGVGLALWIFLVPLFFWLMSPPATIDVVSSSHEPPVITRDFGVFEARSEMKRVTGLPRRVSVTFEARGKRNPLAKGASVYLRPIRAGTTTIPLTDLQVQSGWTEWGNYSRLFAAAPDADHPAIATWSDWQEADLTFDLLKGPWLGILDVVVDGKPFASVDLYAPNEAWETLTLPLPSARFHTAFRRLPASYDVAPTLTPALLSALVASFVWTLLILGCVELVRRLRQPFAAYVAFCFALLFVLFLCNGNSFFDWDNFNYAFISAEVFFEGQTLYRDIIADKTPVTHLLFTPISWARSPLAMSLYFSAVIALNVWLCRRLIVSLRIDAALATAAACTYIPLSICVLSEGHIVSLSHLSNTCLLAASVLWVEGRRAFFAALVLGAAIGLRQNNALLLVWLPVLRFGTWRMALHGALGLCAAGALVIGLGLLVADPALFHYYVLEFPQKYIEMFGAPKLGDYVMCALYFLGVIWPFLFLHVINGIAADRKEWLKLTVLLGVTLATTIAPNRTFNHYAAYLIPWCTIVLARSLTLVSLARWPGLAAAVVVCAFFATRAMARLRPNDVTEQHADAIALWHEVDRIAAPRAPIYVFGGTCWGLNQGGLYWFLNHPPAHPLSEFFSLMPAHQAVLPESQRDFWPRMERSPPEVVLFAPTSELPYYVDAPLLKKIRAYFYEHYEPTANIGGFIVGARKK